MVPLTVRNVLTGASKHPERLFTNPDGQIINHFKYTCNSLAKML
ncbi:MAG: hypothetical protein U0Y96_01565 [Candidatus Kapaibacterium sp.]